MPAVKGDSDINLSVHPCTLDDLEENTHPMLRNSTCDKREPKIELVHQLLGVGTTVRQT